MRILIPRTLRHRSGRNSREQPRVLAARCSRHYSWYNNTREWAWKVLSMGTGMGIVLRFASKWSIHHALSWWSILPAYSSFKTLRYRRQRRASPLIISLSFIVQGSEWSPGEECAFRLRRTARFPFSFRRFLHAYFRVSKDSPLQLLRKGRRVRRTVYIVSCYVFSSLLNRGTFFQRWPKTFR